MSKAMKGRESVKQLCEEKEESVRSEGKDVKANCSMED